MNKTTYESPELLVLRLAARDLLNASGEPGDGTAEDNYGDSSNSF